MAEMGSRAQRELKYGDGKSVFAICILIEKKYNQNLDRDKRAITRGPNDMYPNLDT